MQQSRLAGESENLRQDSLLRRKGGPLAERNYYLGIGREALRTEGEGFSKRAPSEKRRDDELEK